MDEFGTSAAVWDGDSPVTSPQEPSSTLSWAGEGDGQHEQCQCSSGDGRPCVCQGYSGIWDFDEPEVGANSFHGVSAGPAHHGPPTFCSSHAIASIFIMLGSIFYMENYYLVWDTN